MKGKKARKREEWEATKRNARKNDINNRKRKKRKVKIWHNKAENQTK